MYFHHEHNCDYERKELTDGRTGRRTDAVVSLVSKVRGGALKYPMNYVVPKISIS